MKKTDYKKVREQLQKDRKDASVIASEYNVIYRASWEMPWRVKTTPAVVRSVAAENIKREQKEAEVERRRLRFQKGGKGKENKKQNRPGKKSRDKIQRKKERDKAP